MNINTTSWFKGTYGWNKGNDVGHFPPALCRNTFCRKEGSGAKERKRKWQKLKNKSFFAEQSVDLCKGKKNALKFI